MLKIFITVIGCLAYYFIREWAEPGYLQWVWNNELGGRFLTSLENPNVPYYFYFHLLFTQTGYWIVFVVPIAIVAMFLRKPIDHTNLYLLSCVIFFFIIIQSAQTKNIWYSLPMIPFLALIFAIGLELLIDVLSIRLQNQSLLTNKSRVILFSTIVCLTFPYIKKINTTLDEHNELNDHKEYIVTNFIRSELKKAQKSTWTYIDFEYNAHNWFYIDRMKDLGHSVGYASNLESAKPGDILLLGNPIVLDSISKQFSYTELSVSPQLQIINLLSEKNQNIQKREVDIF